MLVAAVDTATLTLSVALVKLPGGRSLGDRHEPAGGEGHSARLPVALTELLKEQGKSIPDVEGYAVGLGPGSFTGLRIGLATWKGLAYANRRPIAGVSSLAAMALAASARPEQGQGPGRGAPVEGRILVPLLDAKRGEVYAGFYRLAEGGVEAVAPEAALSPPALLDKIASMGKCLGFGEGHAAYGELLAERLPELAGAPQTPPAWAIAALVGDTLAKASFDAQTIFSLEPHYLRPSEAEIKYPQGLVPPPASKLH
jgi:tRNA threonylcarbamoyladenosine biosynthesis protein TsaB